MLVGNSHTVMACATHGVGGTGESYPGEVIDPRTVLVVAGPTATGKSDLALELAQAFGGPQQVEIVNADSMQVYCGMDIGTAKLPVPMRRSFTHHLLDVWPITHAVTVAQYQVTARARIDEIQSRGHLAILVGGSGLYIKAVVDNLEFPGTDPQLRAALQAQLETAGPELLHRTLSERDPVAAQAILPTNGRRIVRALEVIELTGAPFVAALPIDGQAHDEHYRAIQIGLDREPDALATRIGDRVEQMWQSGFVEEVRSLQSAGLATARTASRALGYHQVLTALAGRCSEEEAKQATVVQTRKFARKQRAWFRRDSRVQWFGAADPNLCHTVLRTIEQ